MLLGGKNQWPTYESIQAYIALVGGIGLALLWSYAMLAI